LPLDELKSLYESHNRDSLYFNEETAFCATLSAGGTIETCRAVLDGKVKNAIAIVRPPGHHAEPEKSMGFCIFNNVAVAVKSIQAEYASIKRVLILDWYYIFLEQQISNRSAGMYTMAMELSVLSRRIRTSYTCLYIAMTRAIFILEGRMVATQAVEAARALAGKGAPALLAISLTQLYKICQYSLERRGLRRL
jgi:hypothetical protein